jgi:hypothetical protein
MKNSIFTQFLEDRTPKLYEIIELYISKNVGKNPTPELYECGNDRERNKPCESSKFLFSGTSDGRHEYFELHCVGCGQVASFPVSGTTGENNFYWKPVSSSKKKKKQKPRS